MLIFLYCNFLYTQEYVMLCNTEAHRIKRYVYKQCIQASLWQNRWRFLHYKKRPFINLSLTLVPSFNCCLANCTRIRPLSTWLHPSGSGTLDSIHMLWCTAVATAILQTFFGVKRSVPPLESIHRKRDFTKGTFYGITGSYVRIIIPRLRRDVWI